MRRPTVQYESCDHAILVCCRKTTGTGAPQRARRLVAHGLYAVMPVAPRCTLLLAKALRSHTACRVAEYMRERFTSAGDKLSGTLAEQRRVIADLLQDRQCCECRAGLVEGSLDRLRQQECLLTGGTSQSSGLHMSKQWLQTRSHRSACRMRKHATKLPVGVLCVQAVQAVCTSYMRCCIGCSLSQMMRSFLCGKGLGAGAAAPLVLVSPAALLQRPHALNEI